MRRHRTIGAIAPRRRSAARKKPDVMGMLIAIGLGAAGGYAMNMAIRSAAVTKALPNANARGGLAAGIGALGAVMVPKLAPVFIGAGIVGAGTLLQNVMASTGTTNSSRRASGAVNAVSAAQMANLRDRVRDAQFRLNGVPRGVMTGIPRGVMTGTGNGGNIPQGVIVGNFDADAPTMFRPY